MSSRSKKSIDVARLKADFYAAGIELLSAHCATDRIRLQYSPQDIVAVAERAAVRKAIASASAVCRFYSQLEAHINYDEESSR
jgi:hypothetical protein